MRVAILKDAVSRGEDPESRLLAFKKDVLAKEVILQENAAKKAKAKANAGNGTNTVAVLPIVGSDDDNLNAPIFGAPTTYEDSNDASLAPFTGRTTVLAAHTNEFGQGSTPEAKKSHKRRLVAAIAAGAILLGGAFALNRSRDNSDDKPTTPPPTTLVIDTTNPDSPAGIPFDGPATSADTAQASEVGKDVIDAANKASSASTAENSENTATEDSSKGNFTIEGPWHQGDPTAWSWASSLGIKGSDNIHAFLQEVFGVSTWQEASDAAKHMQVGQKISASPELIAKYATAATDLPETNK